ncbi:MAG: glycerate kinase [Mariprofundus sp.]|nr:glycerate kinase [Mariprofundus sp.]
MRILIAPDAFKGSLTSAEATVAVASGIRAAMPDAEVMTMPLADGGEGTLDVLRSVYGDDVRNNILYFNDNGVPCGLVESALLIGLTLPNIQADVFDRGSEKLGMAVLAALDAGVRDIRIALGGSATVDGGLGLLTALGGLVSGPDGTFVSPDMNGMMQADRINLSNLDQRLDDASITVLCDIQNPLCGRDGAVYRYGAQKGIPLGSLSDVEAAMQHWAGACEQVFGLSVKHDAGVGAAGGLGFALRLLGAQVVSGAGYVMQVCGFSQAVKTVDWVVTGEGRSDIQTLDGKLPIKVAQVARRAGASVALISGDVIDGQSLSGYFDCIVPARTEGMPESEAMERAGENLVTAAEHWAHGL